MIGTTGTTIEPALAYWRRVLAAGGRTAVPRWTRDPVRGITEHRVVSADDLWAGLDRVCDELAVSRTAVLLAAHAVVLAALSGEHDVTTGYCAATGSAALPCRLTTGQRSWWTAVLDTHRAEAELLAHRDFPVDDLRLELGSAAGFETLFDAGGGGAPLPADAVLSVGAVPSDGRLVLRLHYRTEALDAAAAGRIAGYHLTALRLMIADLDAEPAGQSLLSADEFAYQLDGLAGPRRELPELRAHQLFEQRVRAHPDAVAAECGDRRWTYRELNGRANQLARALVARGLGREGVVAVVTERNLDWMAAVLAVFKAGGAYLPIEPHFPADRIARMLTRAECRIVLTEPGSADSLDEALASTPEVARLPVDAAYAEQHTDHDLDLDVTADQLAYIFFTSGSTGEPKGAMCEQGGMLNHLLAKIEDLAVREGQVVAQTAPQCFDISLWQLLSAVLVGGCTLLVEQPVILDAHRFVDTIVDRKVAVLQVVPSYLDVVLSELDRRPRELPDLHCVSVTGEALKWELAQRWFAAAPDIRLVNAYGLTETSDDTNHEVMTRLPERGRISLGQPIRNVRVYVVDPQLRPVPLGAPGEIVFSGVCVGRGYINDPERTRQAFTADPHRQGERLYRAGDYGRWLPDGTLEFLGRRDTQVKIRGFRIEIGEIDNALLRVPGVRDGAVVVAGRPDGSRHLVAFYSGAPRVDAGRLRDDLSGSLPEYMVPAAFHWYEHLPLTANGKIDRKALTGIAGELGQAEREHRAPATPTERGLASAWASVLGVAEHGVGRGDHFFDQGGTSLSAVKLAIATGRTVSLPDITGHPVLADLAALIDRRRDS